MSQVIRSSRCGHLVIMLAGKSKSSVVVGVHGHQLQRTFSEQSIRCDSDTWSQKEQNKMVKSFLKDQRQLFNDMIGLLKDQSKMLSSVEEVLGFQHTELKINNSWIDEYLRVLDSSSQSSGCKSNEEAAVCSVIAEQADKNSAQKSTMVSDSSADDGAPPVSVEDKSKQKSSTATEEALSRDFRHPSWSEWATFLSRLRPFACSKESIDDLKLFEDTTILKRAIVKFAQAYESSFGSLSRDHLLILLGHEFPSMDEKTAAGKKKLELYLKEGNAKVHRVWSNKVPRAKLTDVVRLLYRAVRSMPALGGALPSDLSSSIIHLLQELNAASSADPHAPTTKPKDVPLSGIAHISEVPAQQAQPRDLGDFESSSDICRTTNGEEIVQSDRNARSAY